jgi:hypothetical protein
LCLMGWWNLSAFEVRNEWILEYLENLNPQHSLA